MHFTNTRRKQTPVTAICLGVLIFLGSCRTTEQKLTKSQPYEAKGYIKLKWQNGNGHFWFKSVVSDTWHWVGIGVPGSGVRVAWVWRSEGFWIFDAGQGCYVNPTRVQLLGKDLTPAEIHDAFLFHHRKPEAVALSRKGIKVDIHRKAKRWTYQGGTQKMELRLKKHKLLTPGDVDRMKARFAKGAKRYRLVAGNRIDLNHPDKLNLCP